MSLPAHTYTGVVHSGGLPARAWRVFVAASLFLALVVVTDPRYNWPAGLLIVAGYVGLRWWEHHRLWHGEAWLEGQRDAGGWRGSIAFDPPIDLLPETLLGMRAEVLDIQGRTRTAWENWQDARPQGGCRVLAVQFDAPASWTGPPASSVLELRWRVSLNVNTPHGKLTIEFVMPEVQHRGMQ